MGEIWEPEWTIRDKKEDKLGNGGQGATYKAVRQDGTVGVLKKLQNNTSPVQRARMNRESANLALLNQSANAKVPKLIDHNTHLYSDSKLPQLYIVTEYIDGPTLGAFVGKGPLSIDDSIAIISGIASTLQVAFKCDVLHRDLKPDNIILRDGSIDDPVVIDFGLSFNVIDPDVTQDGETFRNKFLDLPENVAPGDKRDKRSDITALAALFCFCLTGEAPGHLSDSKSRLPHRRDRTLRDIHSPDPRVIYLEAFLDRAFQHDLRDRFQTIGDFVQQINSMKSFKDDLAHMGPMARLAYERVLAEDRATRLAALAKEIGKEFRNSFSIEKWKGKAGPFTFGVAGIQTRIGANVSTGRCSDYEIVVDGTRGFTLMASNRPVVYFSFVLTSLLNEYVLLGQKTKEPLYNAEVGWEEIAKFPHMTENVGEHVELGVGRYILGFLRSVADSSLSKALEKIPKRSSLDSH